MTYATPSDHILHVQSTHGRGKSLGAPFGAAGTIGSVVAGTNGLVISGQDAASQPALVYQRYDEPGTFTPLQPGTTDAVSCTTASTTYAACETSSTSSAAASVVLVPLTGDPGYASTDCPSRPQLTGLNVVWVNACSSPARIERLHAGRRHPVVSTVKAQYLATTAFGRAIFDRWSAEAPATRLLKFTSIGASATALKRRHSPVTVGAFSLAAGRVVLSQDVGGVQAASRRLLDRHGQLRTGRLVPLTKPSIPTDVQPDVLAASRSTSVYAIADSDNTSDVHRLVVVRGGRETVLPHSDSRTEGTLFQGNENIQLAGRRLLISRYVDDEARVSLVDLASGHTRQVAQIRGGATTDAAISGHHLAVLDSSGVLRSTDLVTGRSKRIAHIAAEPRDVKVFAHGRWVGWAIDSDRFGKASHLRNVQTMAPAIHLKQQLWGLTTAGALLIKPTASTAQSQVTPTAVTLRGYGGATRRLLPPQRFVAGPQLVDHVLAWAGADGVLRARLVR